MMHAPPPPLTAMIAAPHVGCRSDGQTGPRPAPAGRPRPVSGQGADRVADYVMADGTRTLAPRGWRCVGRYGSDGSVLFVAPDEGTLRNLVAGRPVAGPAVVRRLAVGDTSGRFAVASVAAMLFPSAARRVAAIEAEGVEGPFRHGLPPGDRITRLGPYAALYTTGPGVRGVGTREELAPGRLAVDGMAVLGPSDYSDLQTMDARLDPAQRPLVSVMIADMRRSTGVR